MCYNTPFEVGLERMPISLFHSLFFTYPRWGNIMWPHLNTKEKQEIFRDGLSQIEI